MTIKNWKKTSDSKNFEAWYNATQDILITLNQQIPSKRHKAYRVQVYYEAGSTFVDNEFDKITDARNFISTFQRKNT